MITSTPVLSPLSSGNDVLHQGSQALELARRSVKEQRKKKGKCVSYGSATTDIIGRSDPGTAEIESGEMSGYIIEKEDRMRHGYGMEDDVDVSDLIIQTDMDVSKNESRNSRCTHLQNVDNFEEMDYIFGIHEDLQDQEKKLRDNLKESVFVHHNAQITKIDDSYEEDEQRDIDNDTVLVHDYSQISQSNVFGKTKEYFHVQNQTDDQKKNVYGEKPLTPLRTTRTENICSHDHHIKQHQRNLLEDKHETEESKYHDMGLFDKQCDLAGKGGTQIPPKHFVDFQTEDVGAEQNNNDIVSTNRQTLKIEKQPDQPNEQDLKMAIDMLFTQADKDTVTVGEIIRSIEDMFKVKLIKSNRKNVKACLIDLMCQHVQLNLNKSEHDIEVDKQRHEKKTEINDKEVGKKKRSKKKNRMKGEKDKTEKESKYSYRRRKFRVATKNILDIDDDSNSNDVDKHDTDEDICLAPTNDEEENMGKRKDNVPDTIQSMRRSKRSVKKHIPSHVRIHQEMIRKKQIADAKVRSEELSSSLKQKNNEADRERAECIAKRFETDGEEERRKRIQDRIGLLNKLEVKKMALFTTTQNEKNVDIEVDVTMKNDNNTEMNDLGGATLMNRQLNEKCVQFSVREPRLTVDIQHPYEGCTASNTIHNENRKKFGKNDARQFTSEEEEDDNIEEELEIFANTESVCISHKAVKLIIQENKKCKGDTSSNFCNDPSQIHKSLLESSAPPKVNGCSSSPTSILEFFEGKINNNGLSPDKVVTHYQATLKKANIANPRLALRNALRAKQFQAGNQWLARELGYKNQDDHIRDCQRAENKKLKQRLKIEEDHCRKELQRRQYLALYHDDGNDLINENKSGDNGIEDELMKRQQNLVIEKGDPGVLNDDDNNDDDEHDLARQVEKKHIVVEKVSNQSFEESEELIHDDSLPLNVDAGDRVICDEGIDDEVKLLRKFQPEQRNKSDSRSSQKFENVSACSSDSLDGVASQNETTHESSVQKTQNIVHSVSLCTYASNLEINATNSGDWANKSSIDQVKTSTVENGELEVDSKWVDSAKLDKNKEPKELHFNDTKHIKTTKKPKNAVWKAILKKEAELSKKLKSNPGGLVEAEAEEEEEEEIAGLEDFGFIVKKKTKHDEDEEGQADVDSDDLEDIVDDVSDNEGDEVAGEAARKALAVHDEKERHKAIIRTLREGYDGRRGGVASGLGSARGYNRFDQLVAADNRHNAKRLGLLNDDEFDSDVSEQEDVKGDEVENETALLDKMLKERFLTNSELPEERFTDDDEDEDINENNESVRDSDDEENIEQERLAKRFAKRARMNRLLETYSRNSEFSQSRLLEEDETLKKDLKLIRSVHKLKRQFSLASSTSASSLDVVSGSSTSDVPVGVKRKNSDESIRDISNDGNLKLTLNASRKSIKRKTSFLGGKRGSATSRGKSLTEGKGVSLGHVLFKVEDSQNSQVSRKKSGFHHLKTSLRGCPHLSAAMKRGSSDCTRSLWSKVSANGFRRRSHTY